MYSTVYWSAFTVSDFGLELQYRLLVCMYRTGDLMHEQYRILFSMYLYRILVRI